MLFTFPSRYWFTIGLTGVFSLAGWARRIHAGLLVSRATQEHSRHLKQQGKGAVTRYGRTFQIVTPDAGNTERRSYYPAPASPQVRFGLFPGRSPLLGESLLFSSPRGTKMFQFPRFASPDIILGIPPKGGGLSHSEIRASKVICTYTRLIAAYHVLHRLREPRHPPCALAYFLLCWTRRIKC